MPDQNGITNTIIGRLTPRLIATILLIAILLLAFVIIFAVYQGAEVDFFGFKISNRDQFSSKEPKIVMTADDFINTLPYRIRDTPEITRQKIEEELSWSDDKSTRIKELEGRVIDLEKDLNQIRDKLNSEIKEKNELQIALDKSKDKFFSRVMHMEEEMSKWEGSINLEIRVQEKTEVFRLIQELLRRIGYYQGEIDAEPKRAREALRAYKIAKGFKDEELWNTITKETVISIVRDYADTLLKESRG